MSATTERITKTVGVCGGEACIGGTRVPVWSLAEWRRRGVSDPRILEHHPTLSLADLDAAWDYAARNTLEIERAMWANAVCMVQHDGIHIPVELVQRGRDLGFTGEEIRTAFEPPLTHDVLNDVLRQGAGRNGA